MAIDDLPLRDAPPEPAPAPRRGGGAARWVVLAAVVIIAGSLLAFWWLGGAQPEAVPPAYTSKSDVSVGSARPKSQPMDLPPLDASDDVIRSVVSALSTNPWLARALATPSLVRTATLVVVQIGDGKTPAATFKTLRPAGKLTIAGESGTIDPALYRRWDSAAGALRSMPPAEIAQIYVNVKPLFDQAYRELGHPRGDFDDAVVKAISTLVDTPLPATAPLLVHRPGYLEHDDPALKALLPVQRQLLLTGPDNQRAIIAWLKQVASSLALTVR